LRGEYCQFVLLGVRINAGSDYQVSTVFVSLGVLESPEILASRAGFFKKSDLITNLLDLQVRPPLPQKLPISTVKEIEDSKLKLGSIGELYRYDDNIYVSLITILNICAFSARKNHFTTFNIIIKIYFLIVQKG
jgi:hypothetical protein